MERMKNETLRDRLARAIFAELHDVAWEDSAPSSVARSEAKSMARAALIVRDGSDAACSDPSCSYRAEVEMLHPDCVANGCRLATEESQ